MSKREVERRHRRLAWKMAGIFEGEPPLAPDSPASLWVEHGGAPHGFDFSKEDKAAQALADAESTQPAERDGELAAALARAGAAELENRAWRALAKRDSDGYHWMSPRQLASETWTTTGSTLRNDAALPLPPVYGHGDTPQAAAIALATKLGLLNPESGAKGEGGGEG